MTIVDTPQADTTPELSTVLRFPYLTAMRGIGAVLPHAAKDDVTAVINSVRVTATEFITTDRYAVGVYTHGTPIHPETDEVTLPRAAAEWLLKQTPKMLNRHDGHVHNSAVVIITAEGVTIRETPGPDSTVLAATTFPTLSGNFPPVGRLFDSWKPSDEGYGIVLNGAFIGRFEKSARALNFGNSPRSYVPLLRMENGQRTDATKYTPVRITIGDEFRGLLQPNIER